MEEQELSPVEDTQEDAVLIEEEEVETPSEPDEDTIEAHVGTNEQREARRLEARPNIDHLEPGMVDGDVKFKPGDRIVVERRISFFPGNPWLDTLVYEVLSINESTGVVKCYHEELKHFAFISFKSPHQIIKLAPKRGPVYHRKHRAARATKLGGIRPVVVAADPNKPKKTRAPRRPKNVIAAEKKLRKQQRAEKVAAKTTKKREQRIKIEAVRKARKARKAAKA